MAANNSGAYYFIVQARTISKYPDINNAFLTEDTQITRCARAPYKGMKQTMSAGKILKAKFRRHNDDLERIQASLSHPNQISKIGADNHVVQPRIEDDSKSTTPNTKHSSELPLLSITEKNLKPASSVIKLKLSPTKSTKTTTVRQPKQDFSKLKFRITPPPPPSGIKLQSWIPNYMGHILRLKVPPTKKAVTTEYNGVAKKSRVLITKLTNHRPQPPTEEPIDRFFNNNTTGEVFDPMEIDTINPKTSEALLADLKVNNSYYNSVEYPTPIFRKERTTEEKEQQELDLALERSEVNRNRDKKKNFTFKYITRSPKCDYLKALEAEKKKPTLALSQIASLRQRYQDVVNKSLAPHGEEFPKRASISYSDRFNVKFSKKASTAYRNAEKVIEKRSQVANLIRVNTGQQFEDNHILSALPLHMCFYKQVGSRGSGRIEHGSEKNWCNSAVVQLNKKTDVSRRWQ